MAVYSYKALDARRSSVEGVVSADSPRHARDTLRSQGLLVQEIQEHTQKGAAWRAVFRRSRASTAQLAATVRELATFLSVGVPTVEALHTISQQQSGAFRSALLQLKDDVAAGSQLADAMSKQPDVFDELTVRMVEVGENAGTLDVVLNQLADFKERSLELRDRILGAIMYPAIVFLASLCVTGFLMTVVVPMLLTNLLEAGQPLPWPTRALKWLSDTLLAHGWWMAMACLAAMIMAVLFVRTPAGKRLLHHLILRIPIFGPMVTKQTISRMALVLATLMRSGIEYLKGADIAARACKNVVYRDALLRSNEQIRAGQDIGRALAETRVFPLTVVHLVSVGQASGKLDDMLQSLAENYDRQVASLAGRLASVLEPILIIFLAIVVGFILFATLLPILEAGNVL